MYKQSRQVIKLFKKSFIYFFMGHFIMGWITDKEVSQLLLFNVLDLPN